LPLAIIAGGIVAIAAAGGTREAWEDGGAVIGAGMAVWLLNFFFRVGVQGDRERDAEDAARAFFDEHGHWPDEEPPQGEPRPDPHRDRPAAHPPHAPHPAGRAGGPARRRPRRP
jgi:hypothetical protein